jgi:hypothetical protein
MRYTGNWKQPQSFQTDDMTDNRYDRLMERILPPSKRLPPQLPEDRTVILGKISFPLADGEALNPEEVEEPEGGEGESFPPDIFAEDVVQEEDEKMEQFFSEKLEYLKSPVRPARVLDRLL